MKRMEWLLFEVILKDSWDSLLCLVLLYYLYGLGTTSVALELAGRVKMGVLLAVIAQYFHSYSRDFLLQFRLIIAFLPNFNTKFDSRGF